MNYFNLAKKLALKTATLSLATVGAISIASTAQAAPAASTFEFVEDFEDGLLNTPGLSAMGDTGLPGVVIGNGPFVDSVQGANPPSGSTGFSYYSGRANGDFRFNHTLTFSFGEVAPGSKVTKAGLTLTDVSYLDSQSDYSQPNGQAFGTSIARDRFFFQVWSGVGATGSLLYEIADMFGDGQDTGQTEEDRILEYADENGIGSILIGFENSTDWEVDNIAYSGVIPDPIPTPALLPGLIGLGMSAWRKRKAALAAKS